MTMVFIFVQLMECGFASLILLINVFQINPYFIGVGIVTFILLALLLVYMKPIILEAKKLDLNLKNPIYHEMNESITSLISIHMFGNQKTYL